MPTPAAAAVAAANRMSAMPILRPLTPSERHSLLALKQQLTTLAGEHSGEYWDTFRTFMTGKISKLELDLIVRELLPTQQGVPQHRRYGNREAKRRSRTARRWRSLHSITSSQGFGCTTRSCGRSCIMRLLTPLSPVTAASALARTAPNESAPAL